MSAQGGLRAWKQEPVAFQSQCWLSELRVSWCSAVSRNCSQQFTDVQKSNAHVGKVLSGHRLVQSERSLTLGPGTLLIPPNLSLCLRAADKDTQLCTEVASLPLQHLVCTGFMGTVGFIPSVWLCATDGFVMDSHSLSTVFQ